MSIETNSTMNRGVEAKEIEIANARLDVEESRTTQWTTAGAAPTSPDLTASYLQQVVVEKQRRKREQPPARVLVASSPARAQTQYGCAAGDAARGVLAYYIGQEVGAGGDERGETAGSGDDAQVNKKAKSWQIFRKPDLYRNLPLKDDNEEWAEPECVEVYRFERVGAWLASGSRARPTWVEARADGAGRRARAAAAELGAAARLVAGAPLHGAVLALRCSLQLARDAVSGAVLALSDYALKPALTLAFNAVLHPVLVFVANVLQGAREAARPACGAVSECAAAGAGLLRAARLVEVRTCACAANHTPRAPPALT